jgi:hypothetical protein
VILGETPKGAQDAEAIGLLNVSEEQDREIAQRQKAILKRDFPMSKLRYKKREKLHAR